MIMAEQVDINTQYLILCQFVSQLVDRRGYREPAEGPAEDDVTAETQVRYTLVHKLISVDGFVHENE